MTAAPPATVPQAHEAALLLTDLVDSSALSAELGDAVMGPVWAAHDRLARDLLRDWRGREIDKTDGFLLLFERASDALDYALAYHRGLATLALPAAAGERVLRARAGLHVGQVLLRETPADDVALGAKPVEVDGVSKPIAARVMSTALGGQTLMTAAARDALQAEGGPSLRVVSHGHWRVKGLPAPLELFEVGAADAPFMPPPDSAKVFRVVRRGELWLPASEIRHSLPAERDAFVGRRDDLQALARRFDDGARLVSVLGIGGCGKTRLATRFGWAWLGEFPGGVWFCDLAAARTPEGLTSAVAQGLGVPLGRDDPVQQLGHAIAGRGACLVILDNFEQLARHAEPTLGRWLERAAEACFLVTTREVLGIAGEQTLALAPMPPAEARRLFMRRAAAARQGFDPGPDDRAAVSALVALLDGLPLAIELAAARVRLMTPHTLLARMSERFKLLASSGHRLDRQATLRAAFDWSWDLLTPFEKAALAQLSVFEGGFTLEAAEAVIALDADTDAPWTVDVVHSLVDKSFVRALEQERFDLLVSVQVYADEHLRQPGRFDGSGPAAALAAQARHAAWFAALDAARALADDGADLDNLVAACRRMTAAGDAARAVGALEGAWAVLRQQGPFGAGVALAKAVLALPDLDAALPAAPDAGPAGALAARTHAVLAAALQAGGQGVEARPHLAAARTLAGAAGDRATEAAAAVALAGLLAQAGETAAARDLHALALAQARALGDVALECAALNGMGTSEFELGRMAEAQVHYEAALALARAAGDRRWQGNLLGNLGNLHANLGQLALARTHGQASLEIARELGDRSATGNRLCNLGLLLYLEGRLDEAGPVSEEAHALARDMGYARLECIVLCNLGLIYEAVRRPAPAQARLEAALALARRIGDRRTEGQVLGYLGLTHARQGGFDAARGVLAQGRALLQEVGDRLSLGLLLCGCAECEQLAGDAAAAAGALREAEAIAQAAGAGPASELGAALARVRALLV